MIGEGKDKSANDGSALCGSRCRRLFTLTCSAIERWAAASRTALGNFGNFAFFDELFKFRSALDKLERALFLDDFRRAARKVALTADSTNQARALYAPAEFTNGRKRAFVAAF